ncbi:MAG: dihydroorotase [Chloroflexi bacterium]|nr:dihydroorotase [Chloroflexota bacterium]
MKWDHIVKNGTIVTSTDSYQADIYIKDGKIAAVSTVDLGSDAHEITDASGKFVLPGFIDTHTHSRDGSKGAHHKEDFAHSSAAGAASGITTIYEMPNSTPAIYNVAMLNDLIETITPKAYVDFGVWGLCIGLNNADLIPLAEAGVVAFKLFWGYALDHDYQLIYNYQEGMKDVFPPLDEGQIYEVFREVAKTGKLLAIHAENFDIIKLLTEEVKASGDTSYAAMLRSRPAVTENIIIETGIALSRELGTRLHIAHLASGEGADLIRNAQEEGLNVTGETCPQYLALTDKDGDRLGSLIKGYPPVRDKYHQDKLWEGLLDGTLPFVCSDHAPHLYEEKKKSLWEAPAGNTTIETMPLVMINFVNQGRLSINDLVSVLSEQPARMFGTYPMKGSLEVGTDADIVVIDMNKEYTFSQESMHSRTKLSPYDGWEMVGKPVKTILRGKTIMVDGEIVGEPSGKFIRPIED